MSCGSLKNTPDTNFSILYASEFGGAEKSGFLYEFAGGSGEN